jgi:hypothetical protein
MGRGPRFRSCHYELILEIPDPHIRWWLVPRSAHGWIWSQLSPSCPHTDSAIFDRERTVRRRLIVVVYATAPSPYFDPHRPPQPSYIGRECESSSGRPICATRWEINLYVCGRYYRYILVYSEWKFSSVHRKDCDGVKRIGVRLGARP